MEFVYLIKLEKSIVCFYPTDAVYGRVFDSTRFTDRELIGTSRVIGGRVAMGEVIHVQSGEKYYLSEEELVWKEDDYYTPSE